MSQPQRCLAFLLALALAPGLPALAEETPEEAPPPPPSLLEALTEGQLRLGLRYRFESVDHGRFTNPGEASTLRTSLSYTTQWWRSLQVGIEAEDVSSIGFEEESNNRGAGPLHNGVINLPVIADPTLTELNQVFLGVALPGETELRIGRLEVGIGDQRFVGPVGWRQNHQSLDGALLTSKLGRDDWSLTYLHIAEVHRIFGDDRPMSSHALDLGFAAGAAGDWGAFAYLLDYDLPSDVGLSTTTLGLRWQGEMALDTGWQWGGRASLAWQQDAGDNPMRVDARYLLAEATVGNGSWAGSLGLEILGGDIDDGAFTTPLATLHKFNGWADQFLSTPPLGLRDLSATVGWTGGPWAARGVHHWFEADTGPERYGSELDLLLSYQTPWRQQVLLKVADFRGEGSRVDVRILWLQTSWSF